MKKTLAKGGKTEKNMKKQSILNLVNSILLLCTLLFSVISFAWYSPNKDVGTPLSFGAGGTGSMDIYKLVISDGAAPTTKPIVPNPTPITGKDPNVYSTFGDGKFLKESLSFGVIDDLGILKDSNVVYFCVAIPADLGNSVSVNVGYSKEFKTDYHFDLYDENATRITTASYYTDIAQYEKLYPNKDNSNAVYNAETSVSYITFACAGSTIAPADITAKQLKALFGERLESDTGTETLPAAPGTYPTIAADVDASEAFTEDASPAHVNLTGTSGVNYVYIKLFPDLDNYHGLAEVMMDNMPFYSTFGLELFLEVHPAAAAAASNEENN